MKSYTVLGFLDNVGYVEKSEDEGKKRRMNNAVIRMDMINEIENRLRQASMPFTGPNFSWRYPFGGFFFKTEDTPECLDKEFILKKLKVSDLAMPVDGYKDLSMTLGVIVKGNPKDGSPNYVNFCNNDQLDFASRVAAFNRLRQNETDPYFHAVNAEFDKNFPVQEDDRT
jgi:hypothetical protein